MIATGIARYNPDNAHTNRITEIRLWNSESNAVCDSHKEKKLNA